MSERLKIGEGRISAALSLFLSLVGLGAVLCFHFPEYLTTPTLREVYSEQQVRTLLYAGLVLASILAPIALIFSQRKLHATVGLVCVLLAWLAGGADVSYGGQVRDARFYISLDWVLLDLVLIATLFINLELFFRLKKEQGVLRGGWQTDLAHYVVNHDGSEVRWLVDEERKAWHIGADYDCDRNDDVDCWRNGSGSNGFTVGIEHAGYGSQSSWDPGLIERSAELTCGVAQRNSIM